MMIATTDFYQRLAVLHRSGSRYTGLAQEKLKLHRSGSVETLSSFDANGFVSEWISEHTKGRQSFYTLEGSWVGSGEMS